MSKVILGRKLAMTQIFDENTIVPITIVEAGPCVIVERKMKKKNGYNAIQLGFLEAKANRVNKPESGHFRKNEVSPKKYLREIRVNDIANLNVRDEIRVDVFEEGDLVDVVGISKGKGFAGVVKRHGFKGGPASHGAGGWRRRPGSIGASADPSRVFKGKKMPGKMGAERKTVRNLKIVGVDKEENLLLIRGSLPGNKGSLLTIKSSKMIS